MTGRIASRSASPRPEGCAVLGPSTTPQTTGMPFSRPGKKANHVPVALALIRHLELAFVAEKPPPAHVFEPVALMAAEESEAL